MQRGDAYMLKNWFPGTSSVDMRPGCASHVTGITDNAQVETLVSYRPPVGSHKLFAFAGSRLFDVTTPGAAPAASVSGLSNARWQTTNFTTAGGNFVIAANGADSVRMYDGTSWTGLTAASTPAITGVTTSTLINVNVFKERVWYIQANSMDVWYSGIGQFAGALTRLNLGPVFKKGGFLMAMGTWSVDGGTGLDDLAVFITSQGEVAVYQGTNPSSANTWALVGVFNTGAPIGRRCFQKYGGDLLIITTDGIVAASTALTDRRTKTSKAVTDKISGAVGEAASLYGGNTGWEITQFPFQDSGALILNVPVGIGMQEQYVMNTTTKAWCQFTNWNANCFEVHNGFLFFGTQGEVRQAWTGTSDAGDNIIAEMVGAFDYFGSRVGSKTMKLIRPVIGWDANPADMLIGTDVDFIVNTPIGSLSLPSSAGGSTWDNALWDQAMWTGAPTLNRNWYTAFGSGYAIAPHLKVSSSRSRIRVVAFDYLYERGGPLS
jgi:hypothetical protein